MRMRYRAKHDLLLAGLEPFKKQFVISGEDAGLHLLLTAKGNVTEQELLERAAAEKVKAYGMSENMVEATMRKATVLLGFGSIDEAECRKVSDACKKHGSETFEIERLFFIYGRLFVLGIFFIEELFHVFDGLALFAG